MYFHDALIVFDIHGTLFDEDRTVLPGLGKKIESLQERGARFGIASNAPLFGQQHWWSQLTTSVHPIIYGLENATRGYIPDPNVFKVQHQYLYFGDSLTPFRTTRKHYQKWRKALKEWCGEHGIHFIACYPDADAYRSPALEFADGDLVLFFDQHRECSSMVEVRQMKGGTILPHATPEVTRVLVEVQRMLIRHFGKRPEEDFLVSTFYEHHQAYPGKGPFMRWVRNHWQGLVFYIGDGTNCIPAMNTRGVHAVTVGNNPKVRTQALARIRIPDAGPTGALAALEAIERLRCF